MSEKIWFLKRCDLFERLTSDEAERLERNAAMRTLRKEEIIYFPGEPGQSVLVLARGRVKIKYITPDGKETIFTFIEEGEMFGVLALLDGAPRSQYAQAVEDSQVLVIPRKDLLWLMERKPSVALRVTKLLGIRLRRIENRLRNIVFRSTRERVILLLLELLESHGQKLAGRWEIGLRLTHQDLASLIGSTRETVTQTLTQLQREGLVQMHRQCIAVLDRARFAKEAGELDQPPAELARRLT
ncbi:MAG: Crp/Fnr family transcriptional regulator [Planctomycetes bacterium]|nr:Crp/Fnr family transcriptional regulator [Planctomycetota bacterium]